MVKKAAAIGMILIMALSLGACGGKGSSGRESSVDNTASSSGQTSGAELQSEGGAAADAAGTNATGAVGANSTVPVSGENMTGTAGGNMTGAAGANMTGNTAPSRPILLDPPSMKTAYRPETEDEKYAREIAGIYLLTDLKDTLSKETGEKAAQLEDEGEAMYLEFYGNGTLQETVFGDKIGGLWDKEYLTIGSDRIPYSLSGDHVTVMTDHMNLTFTRTTQEELDLLLSSGSGKDGKDPKKGESEDDAAGSEAEEDTAGAEDEGYGSGTEIEDYAIQEELCSMAITGYDFSDPRGFVIHVFCENRAGFRMAFNITEAVINNIMLEPGTPEEEHWTLEVEPMSSKESDIVFRADRITEYGITSIDYVLLNLWVRDLDNWMDAPIYMGDKELYPTGKVSGEGLQILERRKTAEEQRIVEEKQAKFNFTILGTEHRENGDYVLKACIENTSWQNLMFSWDDVYVNGELLDPFWAAEVLPNTIRYEDIVFPAQDLEKHGVGTISDITFTMSVYDSRDWLSYAFYTDTSTYRP